jgi:hypothetical protein
MVQLLYKSGSVTRQVRPQARKYRLRSSEEVARQSSWLIGFDVVGTLDGALGGRRLGLLYLVAKVPLMGVMWRTYAATCTSL